MQRKGLKMHGSRIKNRQSDLGLIEQTNNEEGKESYTNKNKPIPMIAVFDDFIKDEQLLKDIAE